MSGARNTSDGRAAAEGVAGAAGAAASRSKLLIVDDDPTIVNQLRLGLRHEFDVATAYDPEGAWKALRSERPDLVTLDLALDGHSPESGFRLLEQCLRFDPSIKVVLITGNDEEDHALRAVDQGAADFFGKPVDLDELRVLLRRLQTVQRLERRNAERLRGLGEEYRLGALVGQSAAMRTVFGRIERVAAADIDVLILGESGTGKELVAREISRLSARANQPFVSINCGAIPEGLVESELFGHEKGTFTDAAETRRGRLEVAQGGIVFLDEVGEIPVPSQVKLLRFLQEREIERVGGRTVIDLDVRVVAATSRDLEDEVAADRFRQDLYYRLSVVEIKLPPLRERREDILMLAEYFLERFGDEFGSGPLSFASQAKLALQQYDWPGNVRELEHRIKRAVVMATGRVLDVGDLELEQIEPREIPSLRDARRQAEQASVRNALRATAGNISLAAKMLGVSRPTLHDLLGKLEIDAQDYRASLRRETK